MRVTWGSLLRHHLIEVQQHQTKVRPSGVLGGIEFGIGFGFADFEELGGIFRRQWAHFGELLLKHDGFLSFGITIRYDLESMLEALLVSRQAFHTARLMGT